MAEIDLLGRYVVTVTTMDLYENLPLPAFIKSKLIKRSEDPNTEVIVYGSYDDALKTAENETCDRYIPVNGRPTASKGQVTSFEPYGKIHY